VNEDSKHWRKENYHDTIGLVQYFNWGDFKCSIPVLSFIRFHGLETDKQCCSAASLYESGSTKMMRLLAALEHC
jgi:hypothetical protein